MVEQVHSVGSLAMGEVGAAEAYHDKFISELEILLATGLVPQTRTPKPPKIDVDRKCFPNG